MTKENLWLMYCIITCQCVDLCSVILNQMIGAFSNKNWCLPYGIALGSILDSKVDNLNNVKRVSINPLQFLNYESLLRMRYKEDEEG